MRAAVLFLWLNKLGASLAGDDPRPSTRKLAVTAVVSWKRQPELAQQGIGWIIGFFNGLNATDSTCWGLFPFTRVTVVDETVLTCASSH